MSRRQSGFALPDLLATLAVTAALIAVALPVLGGVHGASRIDGSIANLQTLGLANVMYNADWNDRQVTTVVDDIAMYGANLPQAFANYFNATGEPHPPLLAGWCEGLLWAYWFSGGGTNPEIVAPMNFGGPWSHFGSFRLPNARPLHDYVNGRFYDPVFYAPGEPMVIEAVGPLFESVCEFNSEGNPPLWASYGFSPAAFYDPGVLRAQADGGFQPFMSYDEGLNTPPVTAVQYPDLKTLMIEHHWVQNPPAPCNPFFDPGTYGGCEPYYFHHGIDSAPVTLFYDGSVRLLPNAEALASDQAVLKQTGGVDGLWHRGTPFGTDGYLIQAGFDGTPLSHHFLTTDGILGRDTLSGTLVPPPLTGPGVRRPSWLAAPKTAPGAGLEVTP